MVVFPPKTKRSKFEFCKFTVIAVLDTAILLKKKHKELSDQA